MKNGIKIFNLQGADVLRTNVEGKAINLKDFAVFSNSKLKDELEKELSVKSFSTKDIINLKFDVPITITDKEKYKKYNNYIKDNKISAKNIRNILYKEGFNLTLDKDKTLKGSKKESKKVITDYENRKYILVNKDGEVLKEEDFKTETITYKNWFRSSAKARVGETLFINKKLHNNIVNWQCMGIEFEENKEAMLVEMMAYMSLTSSSIESYINIDPNSILVINDLKSRRLTNCAKVVVEDDECIVKNEEDYVENTLFDGQALMDESLFAGTDAGMKLLRHHFFKACAFRTNIELFMRDYCIKNSLDYETATVKDRYNNDIKVKDIKIITTENAMKWEKFFEDKAKGFEVWKNAVNKDKNLFGICKEDHESKFKNRQRMSYQMLNTLPVSKEELTNIADYSIKFVNSLKNTDNKAFLQYLKENINIVNANEMIIDLYAKNERFAKTELFKGFKTSIISKLKKTLRRGKLLVEGDNLTVVGNPYLMLLHTVGQVKVDSKGYVSTADETLPVSVDSITVYTKRFEDKEELSAFRNPHNAPNNIALFKNNRSKLMDKYFNFSKNIIAVNLIETELQALANGLDQDSDFMFTTNDKNIVKVVKEKVFRHEDYPCIVNCIKEKKKKYINTIENKALIDNSLAVGKLDTGTSSNQAQIAMSLFANSDYKDKELLDCVIILSVLAQVSIDNAKRQYDVKLNKEINRLNRILNDKLRDLNGDKKPKITRKAIKKIKIVKITKETVNKEDIKITKETVKKEDIKIAKMDTEEKSKVKITKIPKKIKVKIKRPLFFFYIDDKKETEYIVHTADGKIKGKYENKYKAIEIKDKFDEGARVEEKYFKKVKEDFNEKINCTMNYLEDIVSDEVKNESKKANTVILTQVLVKKVTGKAKHEQQEKIIKLVENWNKSVVEFNASIGNLGDEEKREKKKDFRQEEEYLVEIIIEKIKKMSISDKTINSLITSTLRKDGKNSNSHIRLKLLNVLYQAKKTQFLNQFN